MHNTFRKKLNYKNYFLSLFLLGTIMPALPVQADMLPPNWDKMSEKEKEADRKSRAEFNRRRMEMLRSREVTPVPIVSPNPPAPPEKPTASKNTGNETKTGKSKGNTAKQPSK